MRVGALVDCYRERGTRRPHGVQRELLSRGVHQWVVFRQRNLVLVFVHNSTSGAGGPALEHVSVDGIRIAC